MTCHSPFPFYQPVRLPTLTARLTERAGRQLAPCKISLRCQCWRSWASTCSHREFSRHFDNAGRPKETRSVAIKTPCGEAAERTPWQKKDWALLLQFLQAQMHFVSATYLPQLLWNSWVCFSLLPGQVTALKWSSANQNSPLSDRHTPVTLLSGEPLREAPSARSKQQFGPSWPDCYLGAGSEKELVQMSLCHWQICEWALRYVVQLPSTLARASADSHSSYWPRVTMQEQTKGLQWQMPLPELRFLTYIHKRTNTVLLRSQFAWACC